MEEKKLMDDKKRMLTSENPDLQTIKNADEFLTIQKSSILNKISVVKSFLKQYEEADETEKEKKIKELIELVDILLNRLPQDIEKYNLISKFYFNLYRKQKEN